ncbi:MAG TPA: hypothetical protein VKT19_07985 [Steroidobacteraceae bacterium]|nr:hypothetical protein [Steroidobacteraceae bacterium]
MSELLEIVGALLHGAALIAEMLLQMLFENVGHQAGGGSADCGDLLQNVIALALVAQQPLERFDLTLHTAYARQESGIVPPCMSHRLSA